MSTSSDCISVSNSFTSSGLDITIAINTANNILGVAENRSLNLLSDFRILDTRYLSRLNIMTPQTIPKAREAI